MAVVRVGVGVFVFDDNGKFIVGKRKGSHGAGTFALPGGHLEFDETFEKCGEREVEEETGLKIGNLRFLTATNSVFDESKHYVTVFMGASISGNNKVPELREPEKCEGWIWMSWEDMKGIAKDQLAGVQVERPLFLPLLHLVEDREEVEPFKVFTALSVVKPEGNKDKTSKPEGNVDNANKQLKGASPCGEDAVPPSATPGCSQKSI